MTQGEKPNYGIDAPGLMRFFFAAGVGALVICLVLVSFFGVQQVWALVVFSIFGLVAAYLIGMGCLMLHYSKVTKVVERDRLLDQIQWNGTEQVLDVGCGRGLMLVGAARRLTTGKAIGVDIWLSKDQSSNTRDGALENARIEGVSKKIEIDTADARSLPFQDSSFDVVMSHWVVHNLESETDRNKALAEMARVLRPDGSLILSDIEHRNAYFEKLAELGLSDRRMVFAPLKDAILGAVSFGSFRPSTIFARKHLEIDLSSKI